MFQQRSHEKFPGLPIKPALPWLWVWGHGGQDGAFPTKLDLGVLDPWGGLTHLGVLPCHSHSDLWTGVC